jgi:hypothetical protein
MFILGFILGSIIGMVLMAIISSGKDKDVL